MPLLKKKNLAKSKLIRVHSGTSDTSGKRVIQLVLVSPATKEAKAINVSETRADETACALEAAAKAIRSEFKVPKKNDPWADMMG